MNISQRIQEKGYTKLFLLFLLILLLNLTFVIADVTEEQAYDSLIAVQKEIDDMSGSGLAVKYVTDLYTDAEKAYYGENVSTLLLKAKLLEQSSDGQQQKIAKELYEAIDEATKGYTKIGENYSLVLEKTQQISAAKQLAFDIHDKIKLLNFTINEIDDPYINLSKVYESFDKVVVSFKEERYSEAEELMQATYLKIDEAKVESSRLRAILKASQRTVKYFILANWKALLLVLLILLILFQVIYELSWERGTKAKIENLNIESGALQKLIKESQKNYFKDGSISKSNYKIKIDKFHSRELEIKRLLPVLEFNLRVRTDNKLRFLPLFNIRKRKDKRKQKSNKTKQKPKKKSKK